MKIILPLLTAMAPLSLAASAFLFTDFEELTPGTVYHAGDTISGWAVSGPGTITVRDDLPNSTNPWAHPGGGNFIEMRNTTMTRTLFFPNPPPGEAIYHSLWVSGTTAHVADWQWEFRRADNNQFLTWNKYYDTFDVWVNPRGPLADDEEGVLITMNLICTTPGEGMKFDEIKLEAAGLPPIPEPEVYAVAAGLSLGAWALIRRRTRRH